MAAVVCWVAIVFTPSNRSIFRPSTGSPSQRKTGHSPKAILHHTCHGSKARTPSEHPNPHYNRLKWVAKMVPLVLTHSRMVHGEYVFNGGGLSYTFAKSSGSDLNTNDKMVPSIKHIRVESGLGIPLHVFKLFFRPKLNWNVNHL